MPFLGLTPAYVGPPNPVINYSGDRLSSLNQGRDYLPRQTSTPENQGFSRQASNLDAVMQGAGSGLARVGLVVEEESKGPPLPSL